MPHSLRSKLKHAKAHAQLTLDKERPPHSAKVQEAHSSRSLTEKLLSAVQPEASAEDELEDELDERSTDPEL